MSTNRIFVFGSEPSTLSQTELHTDISAWLRHCHVFTKSYTACYLACYYLRFSSKVECLGITRCSAR